MQISHLINELCDEFEFGIQINKTLCISHDMGHGLAKSGPKRVRPKSKSIWTN